MALPCLFSQAYRHNTATSHRIRHLTDVLRVVFLASWIQTAPPPARVVVRRDGPGDCMGRRRFARFGQFALRPLIGVPGMAPLSLQTADRAKRRRASPARGRARLLSAFRGNRLRHRPQAKSLAIVWSLLFSKAAFETALFLWGAIVRPCCVQITEYTKQPPGAFHPKQP